MSRAIWWTHLNPNIRLLLCPGPVSFGQVLENWNWRITPWTHLAVEDGDIDDHLGGVLHGVVVGDGPVEVDQEGDARITLSREPKAPGVGWIVLIPSIVKEIKRTASYWSKFTLEKMSKIEATHLHSLPRLLLRLESLYQDSHPNHHKPVRCCKGRLRIIKMEI